MAPPLSPRSRRSLRVRLVGAVVALVVAVLGVPAGAAEGPGYGGDAGGLEIEVLRDGSEVAAPADAVASAPGYSVRVSSQGWLASTSVTVDVPGTSPTIAVTDEVGAFRTVVPMPTTDRPTGTVSVEGPGPDLLPRTLQGAVPTPSPGLDLRLVLLGGVGVVIAASVAVPHLRRRDAV